MREMPWSSYIRSKRVEKLVASVFNKLHGQPSSYDKKALYKMGKTLGAGTYGIVREADGPTGKCAVKIILKKNVKGNEQMVYDELLLLQKLNHPHIVAFRDWFESRDKYYIVTQLATGGELFDRICDYGKFTEKDAARIIHEVLDAVSYLHANNIVHRDLKPENLLYLTKDANSSLVLADFGIAKMLDSGDSMLNTMAGSFGYAAPEVMLKKGHGKPVDLWSLGVITYTLLCGYSPFRSESLPDLIDECSSGRVVFHERYWKEVSKDAKNFIGELLQPNPDDRPTAEDALNHRWLKGETATEHDILPDFQRFMAKARLRRGIEMVKLANRIEALKMQEEETESSDLSADIGKAAIEGVTSAGKAPTDKSTNASRRLSRAARSAIFREVVLAKVKEMKQEEEKKAAEKTLTELSEKEH
ncbi:kinase-like domain-containing protein [Pyronema domesticum]|nr:kinase-like domain-containing protein [Pyronema domesticum]